MQQPLNLVHVERSRSPRSPAQWIAWHRAQIAVLEQQQHDAFIIEIAAIFGERDFHAGEAWTHPVLRALCVDQGLTSTRRLGKRLQQLQGRTLRGLRLERRGANHLVGAIWRVVATLLDDPCARIGRGI